VPAAPHERRRRYPPHARGAGKVDELLFEGGSCGVWSRSDPQVAPRSSELALDPHDVGLDVGEGTPAEPYQARVSVRAPWPTRSPGPPSRFRGAWRRSRTESERRGLETRTNRATPGITGQRSDASITAPFSSSTSRRRPANRPDASFSEDVNGLAAPCRAWTSSSGRRIGRRPRSSPRPLRLRTLTAS